jgi:hypothetical protein
MSRIRCFALLLILFTLAACEKIHLPHRLPVLTRLRNSLPCLLKKRRR